MKGHFWIITLGTLFLDLTGNLNIHSFPRYLCTDIGILGL